MNKASHQNKVSVIIPTHNRAELLRCAIASALEQTFKDLEIIVADDNSTDHTREVVRSFQDRRIKYIRKDDNTGPSATRNTAILASGSEYIAFLDDDDEWLPDKLQKQVKLLDKSLPNICGVYSNRLVIDKLSDRIISANPRSEKLSGNLLYQLAIGNPIHTSTVLIRKRCLQEVGLFDETISYMEDRDLWIRLSSNWDFEYIDDPLTIAHVHKQGHLSRSLEGQTAGREKLLERYNHLFKKNRKNLGKLYIHQGVQYCQSKRMRKGRKNIVRGLRLYPYTVKAYLHFLASLFGPRIYGSLRKMISVRT